MHFWRFDEAMAPEAYASRDACFADLARVYAEEIAALAEAGCHYVQIDDVPLAMLCDPAVAAAVAAAGIAPDGLVDAYIGLFNTAVGGRPAAMTLGVHLCRGNYKGQFLSAGGYEAIAERLFAGLAVDAFFLEYDTERAGGFAPLRFVPKGRTAVLGLVSSKTPVMEDADALRRRIDEAARFLPLEQLALSPQCGFASTIAGNPLTAEDQRRKLELVVEVADAVWG
jgi:5-methyltetrahydropteroyltriglutamate--homocysteine methyltransferase